MSSAWAHTFRLYARFRLPARRKQTNGILNWLVLLVLCVAAAAAAAAVSVGAVQTYQTIDGISLDRLLPADKTMNPLCLCPPIALSAGTAIAAYLCSCVVVLSLIGDVRPTISIACLLSLSPLALSLLLSR